MLSASDLFVAILALIQPDSASADFFTSRFYYAARLIAALLTATLIPLELDRRARRSSRIGR